MHGARKTLTSDVWQEESNRRKLPALPMGAPSCIACCVLFSEEITSSLTFVSDRATRGLKFNGRSCCSPTDLPRSSMGELNRSARLLSGTLCRTANALWERNCQSTNSAARRGHMPCSALCRETPLYFGCPFGSTRVDLRVDGRDSLLLCQSVRSLPPQYSCLALVR